MYAPHRVLLPLLLVLTACGPEAPLQPPADAGLAPDTQLLRRPAVEVVPSSSMTLEFAADLAGATFECSLDGAAYAACVSPHTYVGLADGGHGFRVRAVLAGQVDATPALASWTVDTTAPDARLLGGPSGTQATTSATFSFGADDGSATFECSLDGAAFSACSSPQQYTALAQGAHTFAVRARDGVGNTDPTPATRSWSVASVATITAGPSGVTASASATFTFTASTAGTFVCALDDEPLAPCTSPHDFVGLVDGEHRFQVRLVTNSGATVSEPDLRSWTVDTQPPQTLIVEGPAAGSTETTRTARFTFTSSETGSTFECSLDDAAFAACSSPKDLAALADGSHTFAVRARDGVGNTDTSPATRSWTVDAPESTRMRLMAANLTSGSGQSYDPGHGIRIFQGLDPDVVMIQEFNYGGNSATAIRSFVDTAFGTGFSYYRESGTGIPNGVISRWPIVASGEWDDSRMTDRDFAWTRIDVPGPSDLWAVSVHLKASSGSTNAATREAQASQLVGFINANVPPGDFLVIGGDFNTYSRSESCVGTLSSVVITSAPYPVDQGGAPETNSGRTSPYDWVLVDGDLAPYATSVVIGSNSFPSGLVFDSRVYTPLADVSPVLQTDSAEQYMQHMAVVRDFLLPN